MRGLKVCLFIAFLGFTIFGLLGLFSPTLLIQMMGGLDSSTTHTRLSAATALAFAIGLWYAFRNPLKSLGLIIAAIAWEVVTALGLLISAIAGGIPWGSALPGIIGDAILAGGLLYFYPRGEKAS